MMRILNKIPFFFKVEPLYLFILIFSLFTPQLQAQAQRDPIISGKVLDTSGDPLIGANVRLVNSNDKLLAGSSTNADGQFSFRYGTKGEYRLVVSYVGYQSYEAKIVLPLETPLKDIILSADGELLQAVVVSAKAPEVQVKGDTLVFNASSFKPTQTATLEDLIKRLPGAEVDDQGKITINGKEIEKLLVDGKEFFVGDPTMATQNLPAKAIERLEMLDKESDQSRMTGFNDGEDETVLNLTFKEEYKKGFFGNILAGYGSNNRFEANAVLNNYQGANRQTILASSNNTNRRNRRPEGIKTTVNVGVDIAQNFEKTELQGNGTYVYDGMQVQKSSAETLFNPEGDLNTVSQSDLKSRSHSVAVNSRIEISPSSRQTLVLRPRVTYTRTGSTENSSSETSNNSGDPLNQLQSSSSSRTGNLRAGLSGDYAFQLNDNGRILNISLRGYYNQGDNDRLSESHLETLGGSSSKPSEYYNLIDLSRSFETSLRTTWAEPLGKGFFLQGVLRWDYTRRATDHTFYTPDASGAYTVKDQNYSGAFTTDLHTFRANLNLQMRAKSFEITAGLGVAPVIMNTGSSLLSQDVVNRHFYFAPSVRIRYNPSQRHSLRLRYDTFSNLPEVSYMIPFKDPTNPLLVTEGNLDLKPTFTHNFNGFYNLFNPETRIAFNLFFHARYEKNSITSKQIIDTQTGARTRSYLNVDGNGFGGFFSNLSVPLASSFLTLNTGIGVMYNRSIGFIGEEKNIANRVDAAPMLGLSFAKGPLYLKLHGRVGVNYTANSLKSLDATKVWNYHGRFEGNYDFPFGLTLESDISYRGNSGYMADFRQNSWVWNAAVSYNFLKNKAATLQVKCYDILGSETGITHTTTAFGRQESQVNVLGRYFLVTFSYRIGQAGGETDLPGRHRRFGPHHH